jgi:hypothetical protein
VDTTIEIIVDRRHAERRREGRVVRSERRQRERRQRRDVDEQLETQGMASVVAEPNVESQAHRSHSVPSDTNPSLDRCRACGSSSVQPEPRLSWTERHLLFRHRPYRCRTCGARFSNRPHRTPQRCLRGWGATMIIGTVTATIGGGVIWWNPTGSSWIIGVNRVVLGALGVIVVAVGAWIAP